MLGAPFKEQLAAPEAANRRDHVTTRPPAKGASAPPRRVYMEVTRVYETLHSAIFSAWADGADMARVQRLLDDGHDADGYDEAGNTPLISAALVGASADRSEAATRLLLAHGADPNRLDARGDRGPLHWAVCGAATGTVVALLEGGADADLPSGDGATALHHTLGELRGASRRGSFDNPESGASAAAAFVAAHVSALTAHGADVDRPTPSGDAPIALAASLTLCPDAVLDALLDAGATASGVHISTDGEEVDLLAGCMFCDLSTHIALRLIDAGCPWDVPYGPFGDRPFVEVVSQYSPELALALATHHEAFAEAIVAYRGFNGFSMLAVAALGGSEPLVTWFMGRGLRPDEVGVDGRTPLDVAGEYNPALVDVMERAIDT